MAISKLKTKFADGAWIKNVKDFFTKINEIIDNLNGNPGRPYLVYTSLLSQEATDAPTETILENTLGATATWSYVSTGEYLLTFSDAVLNYPSPKCFITVGWGNGAPDNMIAFVDGYTTMRLQVYQNGVKTDEELYKTSFEIRVYP